MDATRLYLARHGQVVGHHEFRYNGQSDVGITDLGRAQMLRLADFLSVRDIKAVYSSDLKRAYEGAAIIGEGLRLKPLQLPALRELHLGRWEGLTREEAVERYPEDAGFSFSTIGKKRLSGGESITELGARVLPAVRAVTRDHMGKHVCIVAHGGVNRVILCDAMGLGLENFFKVEQDYGCLNLIDYFSDGTSVVKMLNGGPNQEFASTKVY
ncbi:MAG: histidine phosphatase family protein [Deltaproteobacteria bacterium]|nr:histidine phosphatase family protein [Deltaproteobacteria bacterium]